jgi:mono/diheme cytochrome c family protein
MKAAPILACKTLQRIIVGAGLSLAATLPQATPARGRATTSVERGKQFFGQTCVNCHGMTGQGVPHLGADLQTSKLVARSSDNRLVALIEDGVPATSPINKSHVPMPPKGANPSLTTENIRDIVAYIRQLQKTHKGK